MKTKNIGAQLRATIVLLSCMTAVLIAVTSVNSSEIAITDKGVVNQPLRVEEVRSVESVSENSDTVEVVKPVSRAIQVSEAYASKTPPNEGPRRLLIPSIGQDIPVIDVGITSTGIMDTPNNYTESGWYSLGTNPGQKGSAVIGAHVDNGASIPGVFKRLRDIKEGDEITIVTDGGSKIKFVVKRINVYGYKQVPVEQLFHENDQAYLKLITCHGKFIPGENTYDQRLVVTAVLAE